MFLSICGARRSQAILIACALAFVAGLCLSGCTRGPTMDDRTLENKPHIETDKPVDKADPFRP